MSSIGQMIKNERINKGLKQVSLAMGICSVSYLSKIENNLTTASDEVIRLLLKKLDLENKVLFLEDEEKLIREIFNVYKNVIQKQDIKEFRERMKDFSELSFNFLSLQNYYTYSLYTFRLHLEYKNKSDISICAGVLKSMKDNFDKKQQFIFILNMGLYYYLEGKYQKSLKQLESLLQFIEDNDFSIKDWEIADFNTVLSTTYLQNEDYYKAIKYGRKALDYYKDNLLYKSTINLYIIIGIAQKNVFAYKEAENNLLKAQQIASNFKMTEFKGIIHQNLGSLYSIQETYDKALENYKLSLKFNKKTITLDGYFLTVLSIIKEYSKLKNSTQVLKWCQIGLEELNNMISPDNIKTSYIYHYEIYKALFSENQGIEMTLKNAIKHFTLIQDNRHVQKYTILLAEYLYKKRRYKDAGFYYQQMIQISFIRKKINKWEDL